jgi:hypothetical protein
MYNMAFEARRHHTFDQSGAADWKVVQAVMGATQGEPNGIPDALTVATTGTYAARTASVLAASVILLWFDAMIQKLASDLGQQNGPRMLAGEDISNSGTPPVKASTLLWAGANSVRHIDEWYARRNSYNNPQSKDERDKRNQQSRSMEPLSAVLGVPTPITENAAFEVLQHLVAISDTQGDYIRLERHILQIGLDLIERSGLAAAVVGVSVTGYRDPDDLTDVSPDDIVMSDGTMRSASSLPDSPWLGSVRPANEAPG